MGVSRVIDPFRSDAAVVYRELRDHGPGRAVDLAARCFPTMHGADDPAAVLIAKRGVRRVIDSIVWMRHQGVSFTCVPGEEGSTFCLGAVATAVVPKRDRIVEDDPWHERGSVTR